jgi:hypothetical protein
LASGPPKALLTTLFFDHNVADFAGKFNEALADD